MYYNHLNISPEKNKKDSIDLGNKIKTNKDNNNTTLEDEENPFRKEKEEIYKKKENNK